MDRPEIKGELQAPRDSREQRGSIWRNYAVLIYSVIALGAVLIIANMIITEHNVRFDLTPDKKYSLSDFDKRVLSGLTHPVKVMAFVRTEDPAYLQLADLLFQAAAFTPRLTYQVIDVNKAPGLAHQYGVSSYGEVVVESQGRRRDFDNARSDLLIPAILQISSDTSKHIDFTVGHGERDLYDTDHNTGYSEWRNMLEQNNYTVDQVSLFASGVPDNCNVLVTLGPSKDFLPEELTELGKFLKRGGHFVAIIDPYGSPSLVKFLQQYGMDFTDQTLVDPAYRLTAGEILTTQIPLRAENNTISRSMSAPAVFSLARGVNITLKPGAAAVDGLQVVLTNEFLRSSHESWASGDVKAITTGITEYKPGRDTKGPIPVGSEIDLAPASDIHIPVQQMTRIVGIGSSAFGSNQFIEMLGNRDLAVGLINEMAGDEMLIASRERLNKGETAAFYVTSRQSNWLAYSAAGIETLILVLIAVAVFVRRRFFA